MTGNPPAHYLKPRKLNKAAMMKRAPQIYQLLLDMTNYHRFPNCEGMISPGAPHFIHDAERLRKLIEGEK